MKRWSVLLITDLHYELPDANFVDDPKDLADAHWAFRDSVFTEFHLLLQGLPDHSFDLVAVCGDVTTHGRAGGFAKFTQLALPELRRIAKRPAAVCVVPGNHDVQWGLSPTEPNVFGRKFEQFWPLANRDDVTSCLYPEGELKGGIDDNLSFKQPVNGPVHLDDEAKLYALCLNSAIRCGERDDRLASDVAAPLERARVALEPGGGAAAADVGAALTGLGKFLVRDIAHVTQAQRRQLARKLQTRPPHVQRDWSRYLRVGILHHHVVRFPGQVTEHKGYELTVDSADVLKLFADFDFDVVLTGHKHQPYTQSYSFGRRQLLLVGGATVGGHPAAASPRGLRIIDVEDTEESRVFRVTDLPTSAGGGDVPQEVERCRRGAEEVVVPRNLQGAFRDRCEIAGFFYREVASMTLINDDGDAHRIIEYEDLSVTDPRSGRDRQQPIRLPPTSGYLANLRVGTPPGSGFKASVSPDLDASERLQEFEGSLAFDRSIATSELASYNYQWFAVNAFALDERQFDLMYGKLERTDNIEFTHFATSDPVEELTVVVRFPRDFHLDQPPRLRISRRTQGPDSRQWEIDTETTARLRKAHALRYYEAMNIAALRVSRPSPDLSYGIEWDVPKPEPLTPGDLGLIESLRPDTRGGLQDQARQRLNDLLRHVVAAVRRTLHDWSGPLDASLMWLEHAPSGTPGTGATISRPGELRILAAVSGDQPAAPVVETVRLGYGDGIAGRAIKTNGIKVYVAPRDLADAVGEPDYYTVVPGIEPHQMVVAFPVHLPVDVAFFMERPLVYEDKWPYAVVNVGTGRPDSPLAEFRLPENDFRSLSFQDQLNRLVHQTLVGIRDAQG